jgi:hypothetical protein
MKVLSVTQGPQKHVYISNKQYSFSHCHIRKLSVECLASSVKPLSIVCCLEQGLCQQRFVGCVRHKKDLLYFRQWILSRKHLYVINPLVTKNVAKALK